jgi:hypothetical protein
MPASGDSEMIQAPQSSRACNILNQMLEIGRPESFAICL